MNLLATAQLDITESNYKQRAVNFGVLLVNFEFAPFETGTVTMNFHGVPKKNYSRMLNLLEVGYI